MKTAVKMAVLALPPWQRRLLPLAVAVMTVGAISTVSYFPGGPRLTGGSGGFVMPITVGEEIM